MNRNQAAKALEISWQHYDQWEKGVRVPTADSLMRIAELYGCSVDSLLGTQARPEADNRFDAWIAGIRDGGTTVTPDEEAFLRSIRLPDDVDPSSGVYGALLGALRMHRLASH